MELRRFKGLAFKPRFQRRSRGATTARPCRW